MTVRDIRLSKGVPRVREKAAQRKAKAAHRREVYRLVDERDGWICQACGVRCRRTLECDPTRLEHHHMRFRSLGGPDDLRNIITLCLSCHVEAQQHRLVISLSDDDGSWGFTRVG